MSSSAVNDREHVSIDDYNIVTLPVGISNAGGSMAHLIVEVRDKNTITTDNRRIIVQVLLMDTPIAFSFHCTIALRLRS